MSPTGPKIITKLRDRRQIDTALRRLLEASSEIDLRRQVQAIARTGSPVIPSLIAALDRADAQTLAALGLVAVQLDRAETVDALYRVLQQPGHSFAARTAAMAILERFLGIQVPDDLRPGLAETAEAVVSSLEGLLDRAELDPAVLADAVQELDLQEPDVVLALVSALRDVPGPRPVELLRMLAQDVRVEVASEAIDALGRLRLTEAARALQTVIPAAEPVLRPQAERLLRKQQFAGVEVAPLPAATDAFRALAGPLDGEGQRQVWFVEETAGPGARQVLILALHDETGVVNATQHREVPKTSLPKRQPPGTWTAIGTGRGEMALAEVSWDTGRRLVAEALRENRETQVPLPGALRLLGSWLWAVRLAAFPQPPLLEPEAAGEELVAQSGGLAGHPAFSAWHPAQEAATAAAGEALRRPAWDREIWVRRLAAELVAEPGTARRLARRLRANAEWLALAGETLPARIALAAAGAMDGGEARNLPFLLALVRRDLDAALKWMDPSGRAHGPGRN